MMLVRLDHIQLVMPPGSEEEARAFYGRLLGLTEITKPVPLQPNGGCWFVSAHIHLHLGVDPAFVPARKAHPAFAVQDLAILRQTLLDANVPIQPNDDIPTVRRFYATDPFGNRLEFIQDGDIFPQPDAVS